MAANVDRAEILRGLQILYPPDHGIIELDVLLKSGQLLPGHFGDMGKLVDQIQKYDVQDDTLAIYTALNRIKPEAFARPDHPLKVTNKVAGGLRIDAGDISRVVGLLFDIDPFRTNGDKKDSTTDAEHQASIDAADFLKHKLSLMGWPEPVVGSSGNGATLRYLTDLPAAEETEDLLQRLLKVANGLLPDRLKTLVEVDGAMFDRPRISKVFGTVARKGPGTPERPHRRSKMISAPETLEPVQIDSIMKLVNAGRRSDSAASEREDDVPRVIPTNNRIKPLSEIENDLAIKPCLKEIILDKDIQRLEEVAAHEHKGRVAIATELILAGYSDDALHEFFSRLEDYDRQITASQIKQILSKFVEGKGGKTWLCKTLRDTEVIPANRCKGCEWIGHGQDPLIIIEAQIIAKPEMLYEQAVLAVLAEMSHVAFDLFVERVRGANKGLRADTIRDAVSDYIAARDRATAEAIRVPSMEEIAAARDVLEHKNPLDEHVAYTARKIHGGELPARALVLCSYSAFMSPEDRVHSDAVGSSQSGKSATVTAVLETFPDENVIVTSEASPKSLYYLAHENPERLKDAIIYIDDARMEHIPVLKTFRNEGNITPRNLTVVDGEVLELVVPYRPVVLASSVTPLRDMEQQATSRTFLISIPDAPADVEQKVRKEIRRQAREGAILSQTLDDQRRHLQVMAGILRDEGVRDILVPFDAQEPTGADRRGTGQFVRLMKISTFINQYQRPILELTDGRKFVLAIYEDLAIAAAVWFDFAEGQEFKISSKAVDILKAVPSQWPGLAAPTLARTMGKGQRSVERYLEDLYESGIVSREKISAPGMPWGYWCEPELRQRILSEISGALDPVVNSDRITTKLQCRKYMAEKSSDSLIDSIKEFFSNNDIVKKEMYKGIRLHGSLGAGEPESIYFSLFSQKTCRDSGNESPASDESRQQGLSLLSEIPADSVSENVANTPKSVAIPSMGPHPRKDVPTPVKRPKSYSELAELVPIDTSTPEAEKICRAIRLMLQQGDAPRINSSYGPTLQKLTGLSEATIRPILESWPWLRREETMAGREVWVLMEASA
jgi:predicted transcriptional regulator